MVDWFFWVDDVGLFGLDWFLDWLWVGLVGFWVVDLGWLGLVLVWFVWDWIGWGFFCLCYFLACNH